MSTIDITGIDHAELLAALHNGTRAIGMGVLHDIGREMTKAEAAGVMEARKGDRDGIVWFDYLCGRPLKVGFNGNTLERVDLYDRDAGRGMAQAIVNQLRGGQAKQA